MPKDNCVVLSQDYTDKSVPVKVDGNPEVTKTNSVNAIDHIYSAADDLNHPTPEDLSRIAQNFNNDFIYYTKLAYYNLKNILIANDLPVISELYAKLIDGSYKMSVDLRYNPVTQVFDYLKLNITARAKVLTVEIPISFYYM
ncbi:MAG: hypothetical protein K2M43_00895 [Mycoplasmoidaceae bacterium]|nr:hypothetical protein [Mycoplasmoidaceae bacterium]